MKRFFCAVGRFFKKYIGNFFQGLAIGLSMIVPGVSGGTMAIILGIYEKLLNAINHFFKKVKENLSFLIMLALGALVSIFALSKVMDWALENYLAITNFLFLGIILAGLPTVYKESGLDYKGLVRSEAPTSKKIVRILRDCLPFIIGTGVVVGISFLKEDIVNLAGYGGAAGFFFRMFAGVLVAIALVLPGISGSYFLKSIGLYQSFTTAVSNLDIVFLLPFAIGVIIAVVLTAKVMTALLKKYKRGTYLVIFGFLAASLVYLVLEKVPVGIEILSCSIALILGILFTVLITVLAKTISAKAELKNANSDSDVENLQESSELSSKTTITEIGSADIKNNANIAKIDNQENSVENDE